MRFEWTLGRVFYISHNMFFLPLRGSTKTLHPPAPASSGLQIKSPAGKSRLRMQVICQSSLSCYMTPWHWGTRSHRNSTYFRKLVVWFWSIVVVFWGFFFTNQTYFYTGSLIGRQALELHCLCGAESFPSPCLSDTLSSETPLQPRAHRFAWSLHQAGVTSPWSRFSTTAVDEHCGNTRVSLHERYWKYHLSRKTSD